MSNGQTSIAATLPLGRAALIYTRAFQAYSCWPCCYICLGVIFGLWSLLVIVAFKQRLHMLFAAPVCAVFLSWCGGWQNKSLWSNSHVHTTVTSKRWSILNPDLSWVQFLLLFSQTAWKTLTGKNKYSGRAMSSDRRCQHDKDVLVAPAFTGFLCHGLHLQSTQW